MAASNDKVGRMACLTCERPVLVKRTGTGKLCFRCDECASSGFAEPGDEAHETWTKRMQPLKPPAAPPSDKPPALHPANPTHSAFSLGL